jgi:hypothetical protein
MIIIFCWLVFSLPPVFEEPDCWAHNMDAAGNLDDDNNIMLEVIQIATGVTCPSLGRVTFYSFKSYSV